MLNGRDVLSIDDLTKEDIESVLELAATYEREGYEPRNRLAGHLLGSLFFEPSTRTRLSFEAAMQRLGGGVVGFSGVESTSHGAKGESFADTIRMVDGYADVIVVRHPSPGSAAEAASIAVHPVINAGDGAHEHPTQTLIDLFAIQKTQNRIDALTIGLVGDLKYGRVPHSLAKALTHWKVRQVWVAPDELRMPEEIRAAVQAAGSTITETESLAEVMPEVDILYMTRVQAERFDQPEEYERVKDVYVLSEPLLESAKGSMRILHALPRRFEIPEQIDQSEHAYYFQQAHGGMAVRAALLTHVIGRQTV
jgi:aspartate carbamoyltransferase catalytic subunit